MTADQFVNRVCVGLLLALWPMATVSVFTQLPSLSFVLALAVSLFAGFLCGLAIVSALFVVVYLVTRIWTEHEHH